MLVLRSAVFNLVFYVHLLLWLVPWTLLLVLPRRAGWLLVKAWSASNLVLLRVLAGTKVEIRGRENLPPGGCIVASKHQSTFETLCLVHLFADPAFVLKRELTRIPFAGWYLTRMGMIPVDRSRGASALRRMTAEARQAIAEGRQIIIYPEGTRRPPGAPPDYRGGVVHLYRALKAPVVPVALNSGLYWPRRGFLRHPGTIVVEFLEPIPPGLPSETFRARLEETIEAACRRLIREAAAARPAPPLARAIANGFTPAA